MPDGVQIRDVDHGYQLLLKTVAEMKSTKPCVVVGILESEAGNSHDGVTVLDKAIWNEFGTKRKDGREHVPARSFVRAWFDAHKVEGHRKLTGLLRQVVAGKISDQQALERFGVWATASMKKRIADGIPPENADSTIARKGGDKTTPLVDTGQLRTSINFAIR